MDLQSICEHDYISNIAEVEGCYNKNLKFGLISIFLDNQEIWNAELHSPCEFNAIDNSLPSDFRYREDLVWLRQGDEKKA